MTSLKNFFAIGLFATVTLAGDGNVVIGDGNRVKGNKNQLYGEDNFMVGNQNLHVGSDSLIGGSNNWVVGNGHVVLRDNLRMFGPDADPFYLNGGDYNPQNDPVRKRNRKRLDRYDGK